MRHFFYAVYILVYTGAVFMAGIFLGQILERTRFLRDRGILGVGREGKDGAHRSRDPKAKIAVLGKRE